MPETSHVLAPRAARAPHLEPPRAVLPSPPARLGSAREFWSAGGARVAQPGPPGTKSPRWFRCEQVRVPPSFHAGCPGRRSYRRRARSRPQPKTSSLGGAGDVRDGDDADPDRPINRTTGRAMIRHRRGFEKPCAAVSSGALCPGGSVVLQRGSDRLPGSGNELLKGPELGEHRSGIRPPKLLVSKQPSIHQGHQRRRTSAANRASDTGACVAEAISNSFGVSPSCTNRPVRSAKRIALAAQISVRASTSSQWPRACSGAMKAGVPSIEPDRVIALSLRLDLPQPRHAEVEQLQSLRAQEDVRWLEISVDDANPMIRHQRLHHLGGDRICVATGTRLPSRVQR